MPIIKKSLIILVFLIIFSSLAIAENSECEDYTYSNCPKGCEKSCISSLCEGNACTADCDGPGSCFKLIKDENSFFEDIENDFSEKELEDIKNKDIGSGGITPDSPWYFIDEAFAKVFGEDREEKIAEIITMIEKGDYEAARTAMRNYKNHVDTYVKKASPENSEAAKKEAMRIHKVLKEIENKIPPEYREEFIEEIIKSEQNLVTAVEIASKIEELCKSLANLDPVEYSNICKTNDESPKWQKKLDKDLTKGQKEEAKKFGEIMAECFESSGENCKCDEIPYPQFVEACSRVAPLAQACKLKNDEKACKKLDNFNMPRLPDHLEKVMMDLDKKVMKSKFDLHMPPECEGITSHEECKKKMIQINSPPECKEALLAADVDNGIESRKICDKIMMNDHAHKCKEKGITDPKKCARFMDSFKEDDKFIDNKKGPKIDFNCKEISDPTERLECFDKASSQVESYKGIDDKNYEGPCMTPKDWDDKKAKCRALYGISAGNDPIMGDSGEDYECVVDIKCIDFRYKDTYVATNECKNVGALSKEACEKHISDVAKLGPGCNDCESQCPGASRTDCINDECECYYEDKEPDDEVNECKDGCDDECPGASKTSGCENNGNKCICHYENEVSECANNACSEKCGDKGSDCIDEKCVCFDYEDSNSKERDENLEAEDIENVDTEDSSSNSEDDGSNSDDSSQSDNGNNGNSENGELITGNVFLNYWYN